MNDFFGELDHALGVLEDKFSQRSRDSNMQRLLPACGMVARASMPKLYASSIQDQNWLIHGLESSQWTCQPMEVFLSISKDILDQTNFGHEFSETNTQLLYKIDDFQKAKYLFKRMNIDDAEADLENILKKPLNSEMEGVR